MPRARVGRPATRARSSVPLPTSTPEALHHVLVPRELSDRHGRQQYKDRRQLRSVRNARKLNHGPHRSAMLTASLLQSSLILSPSDRGLLLEKHRRRAFHRLHMSPMRALPLLGPLPRPLDPLAPSRCSQPAPPPRRISFSLSHPRSRTTSSSTTSPSASLPRSVPVCLGSAQGRRRASSAVKRASWGPRRSSGMLWAGATPARCSRSWAEAEGMPSSPPLRLHSEPQTSS